VRERSHARSGNFDLAGAREAHQGMVRWTPPRTAREQTGKQERVCGAGRGARLLIRKNSNACVVQVVVRA